MKLRALYLLSLVPFCKKHLIIWTWFTWLIVITQKAETISFWFAAQYVRFFCFSFLWVWLQIFDAQFYSHKIFIAIFAILIRKNAERPNSNCYVLYIICEILNFRNNWMECCNWSTITAYFEWILFHNILANCIVWFELRIKVYV